MSYLPEAYALDFLRYVSCDPRFKVITYEYLPFKDDYDYEHGYPEECKRFFMCSSKKCIYLLIQFDVDKNPEMTGRLLDECEVFGIKACVMLLGGQSKLYHQHFLHRKNICVGYHCNAYSRAGFDVVKAHELFVQDVSELQDMYGLIKYWSPHGGKRDKNGRTNAHVLSTPPSLAKSIRWVHNKHGVRFSNQHSDGGINSRKYNVNRDLVAFVESMKESGRYRVLLHPQYYAKKVTVADKIADVPWYKKALLTYEKGGSCWDLY